MTQALSVIPADSGARGTLAQQVHSDMQLVALWLHSRSPHTQRAYRADVETFLTFVGHGLQTVTLGDLHAFSDALAPKAPTSRARTLSAVKSLLAFGHRLGWLSFDVGRALRLPPLRNQLAERIIAEDEVHRMLAMETDGRNRVLLRLLYSAGLRVSELCGLTWRDTQARDDAGQLCVYGKGSKTRFVLLSSGTWRELAALQGDAGADDPVFASRKSGPLTTRQVARIVRAAATRAGLDAPVSPHWLRHAHASHALDRGAPIHLVQTTLGHASVATTGRYLHARPSDSSAKYLAV